MVRFAMKIHSAEKMGENKCTQKSEEVKWNHWLCECDTGQYIVDSINIRIRHTYSVLLHMMVVPIDSYD